MAARRRRRGRGEDGVHRRPQGGGDKKIQVIKVVREITSLGPEGSQGPGRRRAGTVKEGVSKAEAEEIKKKLEEQGATVELK